VIYETAGRAEPVEPGFVELRVEAKVAVARDIWAFDLRHPQGLPLAPFAPGAHLTVQLPGGLRRNYSLCGDPADRQRYQLAVKREANGRGGSMAMADQVCVGERLAASAPISNFGLDPTATRSLFIAGGIGITPILSMLRALAARGGAPFELVYCTRDAEHTAFIDALHGPEFAGRVRLHHDHGEAALAFDFWPLLEKPTGAHVYCCGPRGLMDAVADMSGHWPSGSVHFESFGVAAPAQADNSAFRVRLQRSGAVVAVAANQSILDALRANGHLVPSSCESGTCGSCRTRLVAGEAEHRDFVLGEDEQASEIMVCVSRARSAELVLDL